VWTNYELNPAQSGRIKVIGVFEKKDSGKFGQNRYGANHEFIEPMINQNKN
jgi:hypothetical protein